MLVEIAVAAPLERTLTYRVPEEILAAEGGVSLVGRRVLVPLSARKITGYILDIDVIPAGGFTTRDVLGLPDDGPLFPPDLIPLFRWIATYYHYPLGEVIKAALPAGLAPRSARYLELVQGKYIADVDAGAEWKSRIMAKGALTVSQTRELLKKSNVKREVERLIDAGVLRFCEVLTADEVREKKEICYRLQVNLPLPISSEEGGEHFRAYQQQLNSEFSLDLKLSEAKTLYYCQGLQQVKQSEILPRKELLELYSGAGKGLHRLAERELVAAEERRVFRSPLGEMLEFLPPPSMLTPEQDTVLAEIVPAIRANRYAPFLLHGVTGSGKTEVYLQATSTALQEGKSALVIVPEIALATQLEAHFVSRFGEQVVLLHSGLSKAERFDQWSLALAGKARIVIGARSAIFAPLSNLGLIIVDEEHDAGLKQDDSLRYNGRDVAVVRARQQNAVVLLGSATPSVVSYHNALSGKYRLLTMESRVGSRPLPSVTIIDLRQKPTSGKRSIFRSKLASALRENLARNRQSVILINRRGFSRNVLCQECGNPVQCRDCHVSLTLHRSVGKLLCHYCGYSINEMTVCDNCHSTQLVPVGFGTERVEAELREMMPEARIARLDTDTARDRAEFLMLLKRMRMGDIDILVGTQMIAKGHHFPKVTLVGVVWADGGLAIPDYRAAEKTFQLITQVTGRAGRGDDPGHVYIQTMRPEHYAIALARHHKYRELVEKELELRRNPVFPPYVRLATVHIQGPVEGEVEETGQRIAMACRAAVKGRSGFVEILGPAPSPIDRLKGQYRWQVMLKAESVEVLDGLCTYVLANQQELAKSSCRVVLDKDPENMV